jgi:hypothetical protein
MVISSRVKWHCGSTKILAFESRISLSPVLKSASPHTALVDLLGTIPAPSLPKPHHCIICAAPPQLRLSTAHQSLPPVIAKRRRLVRGASSFGTGFCFSTWQSFGGCNLDTSSTGLFKSFVKLRTLPCSSKQFSVDWLSCGKPVGRGGVGHIIAPMPTASCNFVDYTTAFWRAPGIMVC